MIDDDDDDDAMGFHSFLSTRISFLCLTAGVGWYAFMWFMENRSLSDLAEPGVRGRLGIHWYVVYSMAFFYSYQAYDFG